MAQIVAPSSRAGETSWFDQARASKARAFHAVMSPMTESAPLAGGQTGTEEEEGLTRGRAYY